MSDINSLFGYSQNNLIALIIIFIIFINMKSDNKRMKFDQKLFTSIISSVGVLILLDILLAYINGVEGYLLREIHLFLTVIYFIVNSIPYVSWAMYVDFYIHKSLRRSKKILPYAIIPAIISILLIILSIFNKGIFYIDENNFYQRGSLFFLNASLYYLYSVIGYIQIVKKRNYLRKRDFYSLLSFGLVPAITGVLQMIDTSNSFILLGLSLSALIIYMNIQNSKIYEDYLTGLYNRRQLDIFLNNSIKNLEPDNKILLIMLDINDFKKINDTYGHLEGDNALIHTANLLNDTFRTDDFISRYAGDEFVIIAKVKNKKAKTKIINRLRNNFNHFNQSNITPYDISVSLGYDIYNPDLNMGADEFITHTDHLMYKEKKKAKSSYF